MISFTFIELKNIQVTVNSFFLLSMSFDFLETFDVVVTCFFMDTAKNIIEYLEVIKNVLKKHGTWINLGPLLYHFEGNPDEISIELSMLELKELIESMGFNIKEEPPVKTTYCGMKESMLSYVYSAQFFSCTKKA